MLAFGARGFKVSIARRGMHRSLNPVTKKTLRAARVRMQRYFLSWTHFGPTKKRRVPSYERVPPSFKIKHGDLERERERGGMSRCGNRRDEYPNTIFEEVYDFVDLNFINFTRNLRSIVFWFCTFWDTARSCYESTSTDATTRLQLTLDSPRQTRTPVKSFGNVEFSWNA